MAISSNEVMKQQENKEMIREQLGHLLLQATLNMVLKSLKFYLDV